MDDLIYRHNAFAEENIDPHGRPSKDHFEEWSQDLENTHLGYKEEKKELSEGERKKRIEEMDEIIKKDLE